VIRHLKVTAFAVVAALSACVSQSPLEAYAAFHSGDPAPPWKAPKAVGTGTFDSAAFKGKPLYINFFASWCDPCNAEAPTVARLYAKYRPKGLNVVGVDYMEDAGKASGFAKKYKWPFAIVHDDNGDVAKLFSAIALPVHVFIGRDGKISTFRLGQMSDAEIETAMQKITAT
jgi:thiol-disulfide isomerase/thioredoxin